MIVGIIGAIAGIITGYILASLVARNSLDDAWVTAHELGYREGVETERIAQADARRREQEREEDDGK